MGPTAAPSTMQQGTTAPVRGPHENPVRRPSHGARLPLDRLRRDPAVQHTLRRGPVRLQHGRRAERDQQLLQLVLHQLHRRPHHRPHPRRLHSGICELGLGVRHSYRAHVARDFIVLRGYEVVRLRQARGERVRRRGAGGRRCLPETEPQASRR